MAGDRFGREGGLQIRCTRFESVTGLQLFRVSRILLWLFLATVGTIPSTAFASSAVIFFVRIPDPPPAPQDIPFGDKTFIGAAGVIPTLTGGTITSASITTQTPANILQVNLGNGALSPASTGSIASCPCSVTLLLNGGVSLSVTVSKVANAYSVSTVDEMIAAGQAANLNLGDQVLLRDGPPGTTSYIYNSSCADKRIKRSVANGPPSGVFVPPSLKNVSQPDQGSDLDTANFVVFKPATGAHPSLCMVGVSGDNMPNGAVYMRFKGLNWYRATYVGIGSQGGGMISGYHNTPSSALTYVAIDNNTFASDPTLGVHLSNASGIGGETGHLWAQDNTFTDVLTAISITGGDHQIVGNDINGAWTDALKLSGNESNTLVAWNKIHNQKNPTCSAATPCPPTCNTTACKQPAHNDFAQLAGTGSTSNIDNVRIIGNLAWRQTGTDTHLDSQGVPFMEDLGVSFRFTNVVIAFNMTLNTYGNSIYLDGSTNPIVRNNVVATDRVACTEATYQACSGASIKVFNGTGGNVSDNIYLAINGVTNTGVTKVNNVQVLTGSVSPTSTAYEENFFDPQSKGLVTDFATQYAIKAGSACDLAVPKCGAAGTGYVDYTARTHAAPWE